MKKKKIGFDFLYIREDKVSGIRKYGEEILKGFIDLNPEYEIVLFIDEDLKQSFFEKFQNIKMIKVNVPMKHSKNKYLRGIYKRVFEKSYKKNILNKEKCDLIVHPYADNNTPVNKKSESILSILDVIPLDLLEKEDKNKYEKEKKKFIKMMNKSKNISTLSEYSKKRIIYMNPKFTGKIHVIPSPVSKLEYP